MRRVLAFLATLPLFPLSAAIPGNYTITGNDPLHNHYSGNATIALEGNVFTANWYYDDGTSDMGTGVRNQNQISFIYQGDQETKETGVVTYRIVNNQLVGNWVPLNESTVGTETLRPK